MVLRLRNNGFSLVEVMMSAGILAIGFVFIAVTFPVGVKLTTISTEKTIAAIAADEAAAKIQLYFNATGIINAFSLDEAVYPSTPAGLEEKKYYWTFWYAPLSSGPVDIVVFVNRKASAGAKYPYRDPDMVTPLVMVDRPTLMPIGVTSVPGPDNGNRLNIEAGFLRYIIEGGTVVDDSTGETYRILQKDTVNDQVVLDIDWKPVIDPGIIWVVPPAAGGGRYPCVGIYDKTISSPF